MLSRPTIDAFEQAGEPGYWRLTVDGLDPTLDTRARTHDSRSQGAPTIPPTIPSSHDSRPTTEPSEPDWDHRSEIQLEDAPMTGVPAVELPKHRSAILSILEQSDSPIAASSIAARTNLRPLTVRRFILRVLAPEGLVSTEDGRTWRLQERRNHHPS